MAQTFRWMGYCFARFDDALFCLFNDGPPGSGHSFIINRCDITPVGNFNSSVLLNGIADLMNITASEGGDTITPTKADSSSANIPAQVLIKRNADVTIGSKVIASRIVSSTNTQGTPGLTLRATGQYGNKNRRQSDFVSMGHQGPTQRYVLREGEGIAIVVGNEILGNIPNTMMLTAQLTIGSSTYYLYLDFTPMTPWTAGFSIFNGAGSGVVVEIGSIELVDIGDPSTANQPPYVRFTRINQYVGGEAQTPVKHDTSVPTPANMTLLRGRAGKGLDVSFLTKDLGFNISELGYPNANLAIARKFGTFRNSLTHMAANFGPGITGAPASEFQMNKSQHGLQFKGDANVKGITVQPNEGFAGVASNYSPYSSFYCELEWTHVFTPCRRVSVAS